MEARQALSHCSWELWWKVWGMWGQQQFSHWHLVALCLTLRVFAFPCAVTNVATTPNLCTTPKQLALMHLILASQETLQWNCSPKDRQKHKLLGLQNKSEFGILSPAPFLHHHHFSLPICKEWLNEHHCTTSSAPQAITWVTNPCLLLHSLSHLIPFHLSPSWPEKNTGIPVKYWPRYQNSHSLKLIRAALKRDPLAFPQVRCCAPCLLLTWTETLPIWDDPAHPQRQETRKGKLEEV